MHFIELDMRVNMFSTVKNAQSVLMYQIEINYNGEECEEFWTQHFRLSASTIELL